jgi:phosphonate transport system permease protein
MAVMNSGITILIQPETRAVALAVFDRASQAHTQSYFRKASLGIIAFAAALALAAHVSQFDLARLVMGLPRIGDFLSGMVPKLTADNLWADLVYWYWGLDKWLYLLWTTLMMALFGTVAGTTLGAIFSLFAARNLGAPRWSIFFVKRMLEIARTVPDLVFALVFLFAFGLGPLAGVLAIALHTLGAQGKLFAEVNENVDMRPLEGVRACGGSWIDEMTVGLFPQVLPNYVSYTFWRFEINVRSATIIGFVGAGGIGMELYEAISLSYFDDAGAILLLVFITVMLIDIASEALRTKISNVRAVT